MEGVLPKSSGTGAETIFTGLLACDPGGGSWLSALLAATPRGRDRLGELADAPGYLLTSLVVRGASGRLAAFEYPTAPSRELLRWYIDHPDCLTWPDGAQLTRETVRLRRALLLDDPPGSRVRAQDRARELLVTRSALAREWWRFETVTLLDCVLMTHHLVLTIHAQDGDELSPASDWYPQRSRLVRDLEAARLIADERAWATLLVSPRRLAQGEPEELARALPQAAPHLDEGGRRELQDAYLGNLTWDEVAHATGAELDSPQPPPG